MDWWMNAFKHYYVQETVLVIVKVTNDRIGEAGEVRYTWEVEGCRTIVVRMQHDQSRLHFQGILYLQNIVVVAYFLPNTADSNR